MVKIVLSILLLLCLPCSVLAATSVTQHGITWTFDKDYTTGQFINGDYWVIAQGGGVAITGISPGYTDTPRPMNGSMVNPVGATLQGYDGHAIYDSSKNKGIGITTETPLVIFADSSLVSTISNLSPGVDHLSYINTAAILTVLSAPPTANSFRPGMCGSVKTIHNVSSIDYGLLKRLQPPITETITATTLTQYAAKLLMPFLDHIENYGVRYMHPSASGLDNYYFSLTWTEAALLLNLDFSNIEKSNLLINYIQVGIDSYSVVNSGGIGWPPNGGHSSGRKLPILFAGLMLNDSAMKGIGNVSGDYLYTGGHRAGNPPSDYKHFGEDGQTFYVRQSDVDITRGSTWVSDSWRTSGAYLSFDIATNTFTSGSPGANKIGPWNPDTRNDDAGGNVKCRPLTQDMLGMPEWGIKHSTDPGEEDAYWHTGGYRMIPTGGKEWAGTTLVAQIIGLKNLWNNNALFDYTDRFMAIGAGKPDPFGFMVYGEVAGNLPIGLINTMWDTYRADYPMPPYTTPPSGGGTAHRTNGLGNLIFGTGTLY